MIYILYIKILYKKIIYTFVFLLCIIILNLKMSLNNYVNKTILYLYLTHLIFLKFINRLIQYK